MEDWILGLYSFLSLAGLSIIILVALRMIYPASRRLLPMPRLRPGVWQGKEVLLVFVIYHVVVPSILTLIALVGYMIVSGETEITNESLPKYFFFHALVILCPINLIATVFAIIYILNQTTQTKPHHLGLSTTGWQANLSLGLLAFLLVTIPILGLNDLLQYALSADDYDIEEIVKKNLLAWEWPLLACMLSISAPILEELFFRGILQPWLGRASLAGHGFTMTIMFGLALFGSEHIGLRIFGLVMIGGYLVSLWLLSKHAMPADASINAWNLPSLPIAAEEEEHYIKQIDGPEWWRWKQGNAWLAIYGSAALFSLFHNGVWPRNIPLFVLGLVLGWLAYRTQNLLANIVLHSLFNTVSLIMLYFKMQ